MNREPDSYFESEDKARIEGIRNSIAKRLRNAYSHLSEEDFAALVDKMTRVQLGGERRPR